MNTVKRIAKNTAVLIFANIVTKILGIIFVIYIARSLGDIGFGKYSFALVFTSMFGILIDSGLNMLLIREVAKDTSKAEKYLGNITIIRTILSAIVFVLIVVTINLMGYPDDTTTAVYIFGLYVVFTSFADLFRVTFRAFEKMEYEAVLKIIIKILTVTLGVSVLMIGYGLIALAYVFLVASVVDLLISFLICAKGFAKPKLEIDLNFWTVLIKSAIPLAFLDIFAIIYVRIDTIMLSLMKGDAVVGWYNAAYNLVLAFYPIPFIFMTAVFPVMSRYVISSEDSLKMAYKKSFKYLVIIGIPIAIGVSLLSDRIIMLLYTEQFIPSIIALQILVWVCLFSFIHVVLGYLLTAMNKLKQMAFVGGMGALINVVLNLLLIPTLSYVGAGITTVVTEFFVVSLFFYLVSKYLYKLPVHKIVAKPFVAGLVMGVFIYQFREINLFLLIFLATVLYFVALYLLKVFSEEDIRLFTRAIKK